MVRSVLAAAAAALVLGAVPAASVTLAPPAHALGCVHRGPGHWDAHGGIEDDRYHRAHGEAVTCHDDDKHHNREERHHDEADEQHHREAHHHDQHDHEEHHHHRQHRLW